VSSRIFGRSTSSMRSCWKICAARAIRCYQVNWERTSPRATWTFSGCPKACAFASARRPSSSSPACAIRVARSKSSSHDCYRTSLHRRNRSSRRSHGDRAGATAAPTPRLSDAGVAGLPIELPARCALQHDGFSFKPVLLLVSRRQTAVLGAKVSGLGDLLNQVRS
jgi:hypothetical protein